MKKAKILFALSVLPIGIVPSVAALLQGETTTNSNTNNVENKTNIATVIPVNSNIGKISLLDTKTAPTEIQVLNAINMWLQDKAGQLALWKINQVEVDSITTTSATINVASWSPDYNLGSTTVSFAISKIDKISLREAFSGSAAGTGVVNLNTKFPVALKNKTPAEVDALKGDENKTKLLKWLNAADLYSSALYINQITVSKSLSFDTDSAKYKFSVTPKTNSNVYSTGAIDVEFNLSKTDIATLGLTTVLNFIKEPSTAEIAEQFLGINKTKLDLSLIKADDLDIKNVTIGGSCNIEVKSTNITYETKTPLGITWTTQSTVNIADVITVTTIDNIDVPKDRADLIYMVEEANLGKVIYWDDLDTEILPTSSKITAKAGSLHYTGMVTISYATSAPTAEVTVFETITSDAARELSYGADGNVVFSALPTGNITQKIFVAGVDKTSDYSMDWILIHDDTYYFGIKRSTERAKNSEQTKAVLAIYVDSIEITRSKEFLMTWTDYTINFIDNYVTDGNPCAGNSIEIDNNFLDGRKISIDITAKNTGNAYGPLKVTFPGGDTIKKGNMPFTIEYPEWTLINEVPISISYSIDGKKVKTIEGKKLTIQARDSELGGHVDVFPLYFNEGISRKELIQTEILNYYPAEEYTLELIDNETNARVDEKLFTADFTKGSYDSTAHTQNITIWINAKADSTKPISCKVLLHRSPSILVKEVKLDVDCYLMAQKPSVTYALDTTAPISTSQKKILEVSNYNVIWNYTADLKVELSDDTGVLGTDAVEFQIIPSTTKESFTRIELQAKYHKTPIGNNCSLRIYSYCTNAPLYFPENQKFIIFEQKDIKFTA